MADIIDRLKAMETNYTFQEQQAFEVEAKTCRFFGLWIADKFGLEGADSETYARTVVEANLEEPGFNDVLRKVTSDLDEKGIAYDLETLCKELDACVEQAQRVVAEGKNEV